MTNASIFLHGDKRYRHLLFTRSQKLLDLLFGRGTYVGASEPRKMSFGYIPSRDETRESLEDICSAYLSALAEHKHEPGDDTAAALRAAKAPLLGRLRASYRKKLKAVGCVFHLHERDGISVHRVLKERYRDRPPALIKTFA